MIYYSVKQIYQGSFWPITKESTTIEKIYNICQDIIGEHVYTYSRGHL